MLAVKPVYKIVGTYTSSTSGNKKTLIETGTMIGSSIYYIQVLVDSDQYFNYLPTINNMINSYQINNNTVSNNGYQTYITNNTSSQTNRPYRILLPIQILIMEYPYNTHQIGSKMKHSMDKFMQNLILKRQMLITFIM